MHTKEKYLKLKELLDNNKKWPLKYMFKFIVPNKEGKVDQAKELLPKGSLLKYKHTESLKYVAITCVAHMHSTEAIIDLTQKVEEIPGVMSL